MLTYIIIMLVAILFAYSASMCKNRVASVMFLLLTFLALAIPAAVRYGIGTDYVEIYPCVFNLIYSGKDAPVEFLFRKLVEVIQFIGNDNSEGTQQLIFAAVSSLTYCCVLFAVERKCLWIAILFYFITSGYTGSYNTIRQSLSVAVAMIAIRQCMSDRMILGCLIMALAVGFHYSTAVLIPIVLVSRHDWIGLPQLGCLFVALALCAFVIPLDKVLVMLAFRFGVYAQYTRSSELMAVAGTTGIGACVRALSYALLLIPSIRFLDAKSARIVVYLLGFGMLFHVVGEKAIIVDRFSVLFAIAPIFASVALLKVHCTRKLLIYIGPSILLLTVVYIKDLTPNEDGVAVNGVVPYQWIFD